MKVGLEEPVEHSRDLLLVSYKWSSTTTLKIHLPTTQLF